jgi:SAM-dependent methyltransferase
LILRNKWVGVVVDPSSDLKEVWRPEIPPCWSQEPPSAANGNDQCRDWSVYWETLSDTQQLFREQSEEYVRNLESAVRLDPPGRVLDFGCGFGYVAEMLSPRVEEVCLWDASASMRRQARLRLAGRRNVTFLDLSDQKALPDDLRLDLILVNSVVQYMTFEQFWAWLFRWRKMLAPGGSIIISDLIPPDYVAIWDIVDLLRLSKRRSFLPRALWQAAGEIWRYWSVRRSRPLYRIGREELREQARVTGLAISFLSTNLTHFTKRFTAVLTQAEDHR